jgi:hypothetical protein
MSTDPNVAQSNEQILNDIQTLQQIEKQLFDSLEANPQLSSEEQEKIIQKINQISTMRINLYQTLSGVNDFFQNAMNSSIGTLQQQSTAISIIESELNRSKQQLSKLEDSNVNKIRLIEINDYYGERYAEHAELMKIVLYTLVPIIILVALNKTGLVPSTIYLVLLIVISGIGAVFFWKKFASIIMRSNMNYQEYDWGFDPALASATPAAAASTTDPWAASAGVGTCIGQGCCSDGLTWNSELNQCIVSAPVSGSNNASPV